MSDSLPPHGLQHARLSCPSLSPRVCSNSCPLSQWCHPTISSFITPFSSCPQSFSASVSFPTNWLLASGGQSNSRSSEYSGLISFRIDWLDLLAVQGTLKGLQHHSLKESILQHSAFFMVQLSHGLEFRIPALRTPALWGSFIYLFTCVLTGFVCMACGIKLRPTAVKVQSPNHHTTREFPEAAALKWPFRTSLVVQWFRIHLPV